MVEVHDPRRKRSAAVLAWSPSQISQERERRFLTKSDTLDFFVAMCRVVGDVVRALVALASHISQLEHMFTTCQ